MIIIKFIIDTLKYVFGSLLHNLPSLAIGVLIASIITVFIDPNKVKIWLMRKSKVSIPASVAVGTFTPFCACGTMAVIISMLATSLPWGPIMAFLTSSPLMSPDEFIMISGVISPVFAIALTIASIVLGIGSGVITHIIEKKTHFLDNQTRINNTKETSSCNNEQECSNSSNNNINENCSCSKNKNNTKNIIKKLRLKEILSSLYEIGVKKILLYYAIFVAIGYMVNQFVPTSIISGLLGSGNPFAVPVAAIIGLPLYVTGSSSIPIIQSLMQSGAGAGAMLAFMISGPGTSAGVIAGIATIMKKKAIALYISFILFGAIIMGYLYDIIIKIVG